MKLTEPLGCPEFEKFIWHPRFILTESGDIQEETTVYGIPCIALGKNTERPVTVTEGTNELAVSNKELIIRTRKVFLRVT